MKGKQLLTPGTCMNIKLTRICINYNTNIHTDN